VAVLSGPLQRIARVGQGVLAECASRCRRAPLSPQASSPAQRHPDTCSTHRAAAEPLPEARCHAPRHGVARQFPDSNWEGSS
jgi:hypothetical protein